MCKLTRFLQPKKHDQAGRGDHGIPSAQQAGNKAPNHLSKVKNRKKKPGHVAVAPLGDPKAPSSGHKNYPWVQRYHVIFDERHTNFNPSKCNSNNHEIILNPIKSYFPSNHFKSHQIILNPMELLNPIN